MAQRSHAGRPLLAQVAQVGPARTARAEVGAQGDQLVGRRYAPGHGREVVGVAGAVGAFVDRRQPLSQGRAALGQRQVDLRARPAGLGLDVA